MTIGPGSQFGHYEITGTLGKGGMGEVWRARDTKLEREVAIKTLPANFADDADRLARFEREAKLLASLNHANIAAIHGLDEHEGTHFLAMELVEGETLEEKLKPGALPVEDALRIALQIAHALETAHANGVVHRDLKPANIMITGHDQVKVLDFGLAKAFSGNPMEASPAHSPALSVAMTQAGLILGTAGYMSPEQASGQATDQRADIWSFGVVLYEMLTGLPLFSGESVPHVLADVLRADPDWGRLPKRLHPRVRQLLERCLEKKVRNRYHAIADARVDIEAALSDPEGATMVAGPGAATAPPRPIATRLATGLGLALVGAAIAALVAWTRWPEAESPQVTRFRDVIEIPNIDLGEVAITRDGSRIAYLAGNPAGVFVRDIDAFEARPMAETVGRVNDVACFSPDGEWIAYVTTDSDLRKVPVAGGRSLLLTEEARLPGTCDWSDDGYIYFLIPNAAGGIGRVSESGGPVETLTAPDSAAGEITHIYPQRIPTGNLMLFSLFGSDLSEADIKVAIQDLTTGEQTILLERAGLAHFAPSGSRPGLGHIVYGFDGALFAAPFDAASRQVAAASPVLDGVSGTSLLTVSTTSANGTLTYFTGSFFLDTAGGSTMALHRVEPGGRVDTVPLPAGVHYAVEAAPDSQSAVLDALNVDELRADLWSFEFDTGRNTRLTFDGNNFAPIFTHDGRYLLYGHAAGITMNEPSLMSVPTDRSDQPPVTLVTLESAPVFPTSLHPTEPVLMGILGRGEEAGEIALLRLPDDLSVDSGATEADLEFLLQTEFDERHAVFSPDGRWVAYSANESGRREVYVVPYPASGRKEQVSVAGGSHPQWSADGDALYFLNGSALMVAEVDLVEAGGRFRAGTPRLVLDDPEIVGVNTISAATANIYDVMPDGSGLLMLGTGVSGQRTSAALNVVQNWFEELRRLAPFPEGWE